MSSVADRIKESKKPCDWCGDEDAVVIVNGKSACPAHLDDAFAEIGNTLRAAGLARQI